MAIRAGGTNCGRGFCVDVKVVKVAPVGTPPQSVLIARPTPAPPRPTTVSIRTVLSGSPSGLSCRTIPVACASQQGRPAERSRSPPRSVSHMHATPEPDCRFADLRLRTLHDCTAIERSCHGAKIQQTCRICAHDTCAQYESIPVVACISCWNACNAEAPAVHQQWQNALAMFYKYNWK